MSKAPSSGSPQWALLGLLGFAVFASVAAGYVFFVHSPTAKDDGGRAEFSRDDVRRAVEDALDEHESAKLAKDDSPKSKALAALDAKIVDLGKKHKALIDRLEKLAQDPPTLAKNDNTPYVIPERARVEELVSTAILHQKEEEDRLEKEKEVARQKAQRDARLTRQVEELTKLLGLDAKQADVMKEALGTADQARSDIFAKMGNMRGGGQTDFDPAAMRQSWQGVQDEMRGISDRTNAVLKESLNADQFTKYEKWSEEQNPMRGPRGGFGGFGGGPGGGGTGGGRQDAANPAEPSATPAGGNGQGGGQGGGRRAGRGGQNAPNRRGN